MVRTLGSRFAQLAVIEVALKLWMEFTDVMRQPGQAGDLTCAELSAKSGGGVRNIAQMTHEIVSFALTISAVSDWGVC